MIMSLFDAVSLITTIVARCDRLHIKADILGFSNHGIQTPVTDLQNHKDRIRQAFGEVTNIMRDNTW